MIYYFVGMPGSGKTTLGKELAENLNYAFIDLDEWIEEDEKLEIPLIFEKYGQEYFRMKESEALAVLSKGNNAIISTGGGAPCFNNNMELINNSGISIFIDVPLEELIKRLKAGKQNRPLVKGLSDEDLELKLSGMIAERTPFYKLSKIYLSGSDIKLPEILSVLKKES